MLKVTSNSVPGFPRILKRLTAAGLSRILDHMLSGPFGIISAARGGPDDVERNGKLKNLLKEQGRGFIDFQGGYLYEEDGQPKVPVKEASVFIPNIDEEALKELAGVFEQESYIFGDRGSWSLKETASGASWAEGLVEDTFEALKNKEVDEDHPYMSQNRSNKGQQFRLDPDLVQRRRQEQEEIARDQHDRQHRVAFRVVGKEAPCFYSIAQAEFRPRPPVCLAASDIKLSGTCPDGQLLECWLPLQAI